MDLLSAVPGRYSRNALSDIAPELIVGLRGIKGNVWYVDSAKASGVAGQGYNGFSDALLTLNAAVALATAGDIVMVAPGHAETITAAGGVTLSKAGIQWIGLGVGRNRPTFSYTTSTAATFLISAANQRIVNMVFRPVGVDAVVTAVSVTAADVEIVGCDFETGTAAGQATAIITTTAAADRFGLFGCRFYGSTDAGTAVCVIIVGGDAHRIVGNIAQGNYTTTLGFLQNVTTACTNTVVADNIVNNRTASSAVCITMVAASTGHIYNNRLQVLTGTAPIVAAAMSWAGGNYYAATIATAGTLI